MEKSVKNTLADVHNRWKHFEKYFKFRAVDTGGKGGRGGADSNFLIVEEKWRFP